ncbi:MAG: nuclear transport factor 2 family protein [Mesorhizobium sp.]|jgi:hypothetical protein
MGEFSTDAQRRRAVVKEIMDAVMSGTSGTIARYFAPGAVFSNKNNAGIIDAAWFDRMEGEYRLNGEEEAKAFLNELLKRATYISYKPRGTIVEGDEAASRCDWTREDEQNGSLVTGTTMYWFGFTSDGRIRSIETIGSIHSVIAARRADNAIGPML